MSPSNAPSGTQRAQTRRYPPVGRCIYCGSIDPPLTREHIIPEGLGGREYLASASCERCRQITEQFERSVLREMVWPLRVALGMRGKRKLPTHLPLRGLRPDGSRRTASVPAAEVGLKAVLPVFDLPPGLLAGRQPDAEFRFSCQVLVDHRYVGAFGAAGGHIDIDLLAFMKMLAKMAHAQAVATFGLFGFEAYLPPLILGQDDARCTYFVGCAPIEEQPPEPCGNSILVYRQRDPHEGVLLARIRVFAQQGGPVYDVAVGKLHAGVDWMTHAVQFQEQKQRKG